MKTRLLEFGLG